MKIEIKQAANGYVLDVFETHELKEYKAMSLIFKDDLSSLKDMLGEITDLLSPSISRHDEERIYNVMLPGDKHESFTEEMGSVIWRNK